MCLRGRGVARRQGEEEIHWVWEGTKGRDESGAKDQIHTWENLNIFKLTPYAVNLNQKAPIELIHKYKFKKDFLKC